MKASKEVRRVVVQTDAMTRKKAQTPCFMGVI
jgi:hypothetical protein